MKFDISVLEVGIVCTALIIAKNQQQHHLDNLDHDRFPNMGRILNDSINKNTDLINRLDLLVNPKVKN